MKHKFLNKYPQVTIVGDLVRFLRGKEGEDRGLKARGQQKMSRVASLEDWLRFPLFMRATNIIPPNWYSSLLSGRLGTGSQPELNQSAENNRRIKSSFGYELGYLVGMDFFPRYKFNDGQLAVIDWSDEINKRIHVGNSRKQGGPYDAHTNDMVREYLRLTSEYGIPQDWRVPVSINLHDVSEDHPAIREVADELKDITSQAKAQGLSKEPNGSRLLRREIKERRKTIGGQLIADFIGMVDGLKTEEKADLKLGGAFALGIDDWLTRHTEERFFFQSIYPLHIRHSAAEYANSKLRNPFQSHVLQVLGVTSGMEPLDYLQARVAEKGLDRIALSREVSPRFPKKSQIRELERILQQDPVLMNGHGEPKRLSQIYGQVEFKAEDVPRPYNLNIIYRNFIVLQNIHLALNRYGQQIIQQRQQNPVAYEYLQLTLAIRNVLLSETGRVIQNLKDSYETDLSRKEVAHETEALAMNVRDYPRFFKEITGNGAISRGTLLDTVYRGRWKELDDRKLIDNYRNVLEYEILLQNFSEARQNTANLDPSAAGKPFNMFKLKGLTDKVKPVEFNPRVYRT